MQRSFIAIAAAAAVFVLCASPAAAAGPEDITREKILEAGKEWQEKHSQYQPEADLIAALKAKLSAGTRIDVYLGLWCPDSRNNVPPFIKILDLLDAPLTVRYFSVGRKASRDIQYYVEDLQVERVPTFIFFKGGQEIGRIVENPKAGMLEDFMEIVFKE